MVTVGMTKTAGIFQPDHGQVSASFATSLLPSSPMNWNTLTSPDELDALLAESAQHPIVVFKHSTTCSISATAKSRLERQWDDIVGPAIKPYYLDLLRYRPLSNEVAKRLGVMHESPQLLLIQNGVCTYDASHLGIRLDTVRDKVKTEHSSR